MLRSVKTLLPKIESSTQLHALIYDAQELNLIPKSYEFDYSMNVPFSNDLEHDLLSLEKEQQVDSHERIYDYDSLSRLAQLSTKELVNISRVLYLKKTFPNLDNQELQEKARRTFFLSKDQYGHIISTILDCSGGNK